jgi:hypothetical protein
MLSYTLLEKNDKKIRFFSYFLTEHCLTYGTQAHMREKNPRSIRRVENFLSW